MVTLHRVSVYRKRRRHIVVVVSGVRHSAGPHASKQVLSFHATWLGGEGWRPPAAFLKLRFCHANGRMQVVYALQKSASGTSLAHSGAWNAVPQAG